LQAGGDAAPWGDIIPGAVISRESELAMPNAMAVCPEGNEESLNSKPS
jgi:hypothetical protein